MNTPDNFRNLQQRLLQPKRKGSQFLKSILPIGGMILAMAALAYLGWNAYQENVGPVDISKIPVVKADDKPYKIEAQSNAEDGAGHEKKVYEEIASDRTATDDNTNSGINVVTQGTEEPIDRSKAKSEETTLVETKPVVEEAKPTPQETAAAAPAQENKIQDNRLPDDDADVEKPAEGVAAAPAAETVPTAVTEAKKPDEKKANEEKPAESAKKTATEKISAKAIKVQLGAYKSADEAKQDWARISRKYAQYLSDLKPIITKVEIKNKGGFYRLQAGPVKSESAAREICKKLLAAKQGCFNVNPK